MNGIEYYRPKKHLSVSSLCNLARCPRRFFFKNGCGLVTEGEKPALDFGRAIHAAMPFAQVGDITSALVEFNKVWGDRPGDDKRNSGRALGMLKMFSETHSSGWALYNVQTPPKLVEVKGRSKDEVPFGINVPGVKWPIVGVIDACAKHRDTGETWGVEYKTSSQLGSQFVEAFALSPQIVLYSLALDQVSPCRGVFLEGLLVAKVKFDTICMPVYVTEQDKELLVRWIHWLGAQLEPYEREMEFPQNMAGCNQVSEFGLPGYNCEYECLCRVTDWTTMKDQFVVEVEHEFEL